MEIDEHEACNEGKLARERGSIVSSVCSQLHEPTAPTSSQKKIGQTTDRQAFQLCIHTHRTRRSKRPHATHVPETHYSRGKPLIHPQNMAWSAAARLVAQEEERPDSDEDEAFYTLGQ